MNKFGTQKRKQQTKDGTTKTHIQIECEVKKKYRMNFIEREKER